LKLCYNDFIMETKLYEKIGRQEMALDALRQQNIELGVFISKFLSGEEKPENWMIDAQGQLARRTEEPKTSAKK